jgi:hypothetical protein
MFYKGRVVTTSWHEDQATPAEFEAKQRFRRVRLWVVLVILLLGMWIFWRIVPEITPEYPDVVEHFKYGSIGTEAGNGLPYHIWKVLPLAFPEHLPNGGKGGYASLGFTIERDPQGNELDTPIGFSKRRLTGVERVGLNCAVCHSSTVRGTRDGAATLVPGMPAHKLDLLGYFKFVFDCGSDARFTTDYLLAQIDAHFTLTPVERGIYKIAIPVTRERILSLRERAKFMLEHPSGPGRIDTFTPYKTLHLNFIDLGSFFVGNADFPSLWNQQPREGMNLHWDGNNASVDERNISASFGAGATPVSLDTQRLKRVRDWIWTLPPPPYPASFGGDKTMASEGEPLYKRHCAGCHEIKVAKYRTGSGHEYGVGEVVPWDEIGTDRERLDSYSLDLNQNQYTLGTGTPWRFKHFKKTNGYANMPLDGVWARGPYLHNGSVPTLRELLDPPYDEADFKALGLPAIADVRDADVVSTMAKARTAGRRPPLFFRGDDVFDQARVGFVCDVPEDQGRRNGVYDVRVRGNGNAGHLYGTKLSAREKNAIVAYMKTL